MKLIEGWKKAHKNWSVQLSAFGVFLLGLATAFPDAVLHVWLMLPSEFKSLIPQQWIAVIGMVVAVLSIFARLIKQNGAKQNDNSDTKTD